MPSSLMQHDTDPKEELLSKVGDVSEIRLFGSDVLVAIYMRPEKTKSGIILTDNMRGEDAYQGKVGLIIKMGPHAFVDEDGNKFRDIIEGDWVAFRASDGFPVTLNTGGGVTSKDAVLCRIITDINIRMTMSSPDLVF